MLKTSDAVWVRIGRISDYVGMTYPWFVWATYREQTRQRGQYGSAAV